MISHPPHQIRIHHFPMHSIRLNKIQSLVLHSCTYLNHLQGKNELDASIMDGSKLAAGAVAGVRHIKNPISLARAVMERSSHVMLLSDGAEMFAREQDDIEFVSEDYFFTQERWDALQRVKAEEEKGKQDSTSNISTNANGKSTLSEKDKHGTVGAVALDINGDLAAATSTGGMTNKRFGRVGDSPIIGMSVNGYFDFGGKL